ncbi:MAG: ATP-binding cassette domain-containing protein, partial [Bacteroidia bacterium]
YNPQLFLLLFFALLPPVFFITYITKRKLKIARENVKTASETSLQHLQEALTGYVEGNIYDKNSFFIDRYTTSQTRLNSILSQIQSIQAAPVRLIETFAVFGLFLLIAANQFLNNSSVLNIINIGAFLAAAYKIIPSIVKIINLSGQVKTYQYTTHNSPASPYIAIEKNALISRHHLRSVELKNICFSHKSDNIINNFNLKIEAGEFIGISGASGKGKSTIINLLLGFIQPEKGEVLINNKALDEENKKQFWQNIALVKQQPFVIAESILNNIILGDESYDKQQLDVAVSIAGLEDLINKYPEGIHKKIAENSKNISGGQQQRIALARAIYKNADLIVLDESFSELDDASEHKILKYFRELAKKGKMIIFISHNKRSLAYCDKIISLDA